MLDIDKPAFRKNINKVVYTKHSTETNCMKRSAHKKAGFLFFTHPSPEHMVKYLHASMIFYLYAFARIVATVSPIRPIA
jgi:hypothetical protein